MIKNLDIRPKVTLTKSRTIYESIRLRYMQTGAVAKAKPAQVERPIIGSFLDYDKEEPKATSTTNTTTKAENKEKEDSDKEDIELEENEDKREGYRDSDKEEEEDNKTPIPKQRKKIIEDRDEEENEEEDNKPLTVGELATARRLSSQSTTDYENKEQSSTHNIAEIRTSRHTIQAEDAESESEEEPKPFSYYTYAKELLFGNPIKESTNKAEYKNANKEIELEGMKEEIAPSANTSETLRETERLYKRVFTPKEIADKESLRNSNNETVERREEHIQSPSVLMTENKEKYSATIKKIDVGIKLATMNLDSLAEKVGVNIEKSEELVSKWDEIKKRLEDNLKSLEGVNWKKTLTYTAIVIAVIGFVYQCGIVGKLPNFAANVFNNIPLPNFGNVPKPTSTDTSTLELISKIMEKPVTLSPLNTLTGMGILCGVVVAIKVLRIARKVIK
jgi:hypothetical protein